MITPKKIKAEVIRCLRAGPPRWSATTEKLSPEVRWLVAQITPGSHGRDAPVGFRAAFPERAAEPDWPELGALLKEAHEVLLSQHYAHARWEQGKDRDLMEAYPAQEIIVMTEPEPEGWRERWIAAGGKCFGTRCVALKKDPVWRAFSDYNKPYSPYEWSGSLSEEDVDENEARSLWLFQKEIAPPDQPPPLPPVLPTRPIASPKLEPAKTRSPGAAKGGGCLSVIAGILIVAALAFLL